MLSSIRLQNFRSHSDTDFALSPEVSIVAGPNASGKTNLLEAILVIANGGSFRAKDQELIQHHQEWARLDAKTVNGDRTVKITGNPQQKIFTIDGQTFKRLSHQRRLPVVLFEPNHMLLFAGAPELRRAFLDDLLERVSPQFGEYNRHYKRVLSQRNMLLKKQQPEQLFVWNIRLSELGGKVAKERARLVLDFNSRASQLYSGISGKETAITLTYFTQFPLESYESAMLQQLERHVEQDLLRGFTSTGPHRDDLLAEINGNAFQQTASRGENRTLVLTLKMLELQLLETFYAVKPLVLLDDVFSELDAARRQALTGLVRNYQTILTTTDADIAQQLHLESKVIRLA